MAFAAALLIAASNAAAAKTYNIGFDGYCDQVSFDIVKGVIVGVSDGFDAALGIGCDDANVIGSLLTLPKAVAPGGQVAALASDLGNEIYKGQYLYYINLTNHTWTLYQTFAGLHGQVTAVGTWSFIKAGKTDAVRRSLPSITATLRPGLAVAQTASRAGGVP